MRRRSRWRAAAALVLAFAMLMPQTVFAKDMDHPTASTVSYYTENGKKTGVESFSISPFTYYNIGRDADINPGKGDTLVLNTARLKDIAAKEIFPRWSIIAEGIFRDKADQLVTIEGSGLMSSDKTAANSFDRQFNFRKKDVNQGYSGYDWSIGDFAEMLSRTTARHDGETCWDEMRATGITAIGSLADARRLMGQELRNCSDDDDVSVDDFLGNKKDKNSNEYRLPDLDNSKSGSGFASIVTCVNRSGSSGDYDYVSFGLAVYDFDVSPIAANDLEYITAADKTADGKAMVDGKKGNIPWKNAVGISYNEAADKPSEKQFINDSTAEAEAESGIENSTTIENTLTTEESFEWGMTQHVGAQINVGGASDSFPTVTVEVSNEWSEVWSTMNGKSESKGESKTKSASQTISMPPHTAVTLKENSAVTTVKERYQQPVVINYKVAIFAMSGDYFNGWWGEISNDRYDKQWMSVIFDGSDQQEKPGNNAIGSLYNRAIANRSVQGYDGSTGKLRSWCDKGAWRKSGNIKWADIEDELTDSNENRDSHNITSRRTGKKSTLSDLATELPIIEQSVIMNTNKEVMTSDLTQKVPLYNLDSVDVKDKTKKRYQMNAGDVLYLDGVEMEGYDEDGVEFYGFDPSWGSWQMLDQSGKPVADSDGDGRVSSGNFTLVTDENLDIQYVEAEENQTQSLSSVNLKWVVDEDAKISSNKILTDYNNNRRSTGIMTAKELARIKVPQIQIFMKKNPVSRVQVSGSYEGLVNEQVNLNKVLDVSALAEMDGSDEAAESAQVPVYWEAKDDSGINVKESGDCSIDRAGEYQVRAYCLESGEVAAQELSADASANRNYSEWVTIKAKDAPVLSSVKFDTAKLEELSRTLKIDTEHPVVKVDLNEYLLYFQLNN